MNEAASKAYSFVWEIENFTLHYHQAGESISSPPFIFENLNYSKWYLKLFPKGQNAGSAEYISILLCRDDDDKDEEIIIDYRIEVMDGNGERLENFNENDKVFKGKESSGTDKFIKREELINKINDWKESILTVFCELSSKHVDGSHVTGCEARSKLELIQHVLEKSFDIDKPSSWRFDPPLPFYFDLKAPVDEFEIGALPTGSAINIRYRMTTIRISLMDVKGGEIVSKCYSRVLDTQYYPFHPDWKLPRFFSKSMLLNQKDTLLHENKFTLKSEVSFHDGSAISTIKNYTRNTSPVGFLNSDVNTISTLLSNLRDMFTLKEFCDMKLRVESQIIPVHKAILAARSEVFSVMFDQDMLESKTGIVDVQDMTIDSVNSLLEFMYTGSVKDLDYDKALELLIAAEKYQVFSLKEMCSSYLMSVLSESNVCDVLVIADMIGYAPLKTSTIGFIQKNYEKVMSSTKWPEWVKINNKLATEIILQLSNRINNAK